MTDREKAIVMAYTGICMLEGEKFHIFHNYVEEIMDRPILTHEIGLLADAIKDKSKADFLALCKSESRKMLSVENVMSVFDDFMRDDVDEDDRYTFLEMLKDKAESEVQSC